MYTPILKMQLLNSVVALCSRLVLYHLNSSISTDASSVSRWLGFGGERGRLDIDEALLLPVFGSELVYDGFEGLL